MINLDWKDGFGFWNRKHCEKTKFLLGIGIVATLYSIYLLQTGRWIYPIEFFYLAILTIIGGFAGVIFYKITNHKKITPKTLLFFWTDG